MNRMKKGLPAFILITGILLFGFVLFTLFRNKMASDYYQHAIERISYGYYEDAEKLLYRVPENYKDREVLLAFVHEQMRDGLTDKYRLLEIIPDNYSGVLSEKILDEKTRVNIEYQAFQEEIREELELEKAQEEEQMRERYAATYPSYGMREEVLRYCALGKPKIEKCNNFYGLVPRARYKTYTFGEPGNKNSGVVTIRFRFHYSNRSDDYIDYPSDNGYAASGYYFDADGIRYDFDHEGTNRNLQVSPLDGSKYNSRKSSGTVTDKSENSDPYNVQDYDDPEEFYYDWMEDFDGFEDAEQYWDDAQ